MAVSSLGAAGTAADGAVAGMTIAGAEAAKTEAKMKASRQVEVFMSFLQRASQGRRRKSGKNRFLRKVLMCKADGIRSSMSPFQAIPPQPSPRRRTDARERMH